MHIDVSEVEALGDRRICEQELINFPASEAPENAPETVQNGDRGEIQHCEHLDFEVS